MYGPAWLPLPSEVKVSWPEILPAPACFPIGSGKGDGPISYLGLAIIQGQRTPVRRREWEWLLELRGPCGDTRVTFRDKLSR